MYNLLQLLFFYSILTNGCLTHTAQDDDSPTICIESATCFRGAWIGGSGISKFASFQGIRYAKPPIDDLRFKAPQMYHYSEEMIDVSNFSEVFCSQLDFNSGMVLGQEDCLVLNVYVPDSVFSNPQIKIPVMVWIYGGALVSGSNLYLDYGPLHFVSNEVIVVTINYRLGPLGFLSMGTEYVPGNAGLFDQSLALKWVNYNIDSFGGDPNSVTIFGESAGSLSVALHLISPISERLFNKAILQSDSALGPSWGLITPQHALQFADKFYKSLGCEEMEHVLKCIQKKDVSEILELTDLVENAVVWMAVPDYNFTSNPFLPGDVEQLMSDGQFNKDIEVIIGRTADEGMLSLFEQLLDPTKWEDFKNNFDTIGVQSLFSIPYASEITADDVTRAHQLIEYYVGSMDNINADHKQGLINMFTDSEQGYGNYKTVNYLIKHGITVYQYILTYQGEYSFSQLFGIQPLGVCHADDLMYLWDPVVQSGIFGPSDIIGPLNKEDASVRRMMTTAWTNFAKYGDPTPPNSGLTWTPQEPNSDQQFWNISGPEPLMSTNEKIQERLLLWDQIMENSPK